MGGGVKVKVLVRYGVTDPFHDQSSYKPLAVTYLNPNAIGYAGATIVMRLLLKK
jgi:hypothetical protein